MHIMEKDTRLDFLTNFYRINFAVSKNMRIFAATKVRI